MRETVEILKKTFPAYDLPSLGLDNAFGNVVAYCMSFMQKGQIGSYVRTHIGGKFQFDTTKSEKELGVVYRDVRPLFPSFSSWLFPRFILELCFVL